MHEELSELVATYNEAVERYNLARLAYAYAFDSLAVPPVACGMPSDGIESADQHRPASSSVQAVREFFECIFDGEVLADTASDAYGSLHGASLELTRRFFQVSLTRMGISCRGMLD